VTEDPHQTSRHAGRAQTSLLSKWSGRLSILAFGLVGVGCAASPASHVAAPGDLAASPANPRAATAEPLSAPAEGERKSIGKAIAATERAILRGDWATAKANVDDALAADPQSVRALYYAGLCAEKLGTAAEAETKYRASLAADPTFPEAAINLSALLIEGERPKEAVVVLLPAAKAWPSDLLLFENLGLAASLAKQHETAVRAFQRLEKAGVLHTDTRLTFADSLLAQGKRAEAAKVLEAGASAVPAVADEVVPYATLLIAAGAPGAAHKLLDDIIKRADQNAALWLARGRARLAENDARGAAADFEAAAKRDPQNASVAFALAEARDVLGQRSAAKQAFTAALRLGLDGEEAARAKKRTEQLQRQLEGVATP
jgi:Tfp pilus assembly protein PilF